MRIYKVFLDMTSAIHDLKGFYLGKYNSMFPIIFVEAADPDGACYKAVYSLIKQILDQDDSVETRVICRNLRRNVRVLKIQCK